MMSKVKQMRDFFEMESKKTTDSNSVDCINSQMEHYYKHHHGNYREPRRSSSPPPPDPRVSGKWSSFPFRWFRKSEATNRTYPTPATSKSAFSDTRNQDIDRASDQESAAKGPLATVYNFSICVITAPLRLAFGGISLVAMLIHTGIRMVFMPFEYVHYMIFGRPGSNQIEDVSTSEESEASEPPSPPPTPRPTRRHFEIPTSPEAISRQAEALQSIQPVDGQAVPTASYLETGDKERMAHKVVGQVEHGDGVAPLSASKMVDQTSSQGENFGINFDASTGRPASGHATNGVAVPPPPPPIKDLEMAIKNATLHETTKSNDFHEAPPPEDAGTAIAEALKRAVAERRPKVEPEWDSISRDDKEWED